MVCGLLGEKLSHSYSPQIHSFLGTYEYRLFEVKPQDVSQFFQNRCFDAINVTIPYKKEAAQYCDELTDVAKSIGAVNTIVNRNGRLIGHNSDHFGFSYMVAESGLMLKGKKVLVLGSGGASVTAQAVLKEMGAHVTVISRSGRNNYTNLSMHLDAACIVNCTPVGMFPNNGSAPLLLSEFHKLEGVLDMIYNPAKTKLLLDAEKLGLIALNGLWMLVAQAKESAEYFLSTKLPDQRIREIYDHLQKQMKNIVLVGMPGSGKTTIAQILSRRLNRPMLDCDQQVEIAAGRSIPQIFSSDGESAFRLLETKVLRELSKASGNIISTGGGCVTTPDNYDLLRQNSIVIWLLRDLDTLPTDGRPLSKLHDLREMFAVRRPLYEKFCHHKVSNNTTPEDAASIIIDLIT